MVCQARPQKNVDPSLTINHYFPNINTNFMSILSLYREPRWFSLESRRKESVIILSLTLRRAALHKYLGHSRYVRSIEMSG